jgi:tetratricopeptide (TPR) repeat protein
MKVAIVVMLSLLLTLALVPEFGRYAGERHLYRATAVFRLMLQERAAENRSTLFEVAASSADAAANGMPGDSRPLILAGSLRLFARQPAEALAFYQKAFRLGERPEIDLNLGRAYEMLGDHPSASMAILRAAWVSPAIIGELPENLKAPVQAAIAQDETWLREHRLDAPPSLPPNLLR